MTTTINSFAKKNYKTLILDIFLVTALYLVPTISHLLALPVYYLEPMRIMLFVSILYTNRLNTIFIAITLPLFSFAVSSHPVFIKTLLISSELITNALLFYFFLKVTEKPIAAAAVSIIISKVLYYAAKYGLLSAALLEGSLVSTPIYIQLIMTVVLSVFVYIKFINNKN